MQTWHIMYLLSKKARNIIYVIALILIGVSFAWYCMRDYRVHQLKINEVCTNNVTFNLTRDGYCADYIELYNPTGKPINLKGFSLTDSMDKKDECVLGNLSIPAHGYRVLRPADDEHSGDLTFGLGKRGLTLYLYSPSGYLIDSVTVPKLTVDTAYARVDDTWQIMHQSPSLDNDQVGKYISPPVLSAQSGFYDDEFELEITAEDGCRVYYTLDSSTPTAESTSYEEPITIEPLHQEPSRLLQVQNVTENWLENEISDTSVDTITVVRAIAVDAEGNVSEPVTGSYFVGADGYKDKKVISIVADYDDLFGPDGIHVTGEEYDEWYLSGMEGEKPEANFLKHGIESEIEVNLDYFEDSELKLDQPSGLRIQGGGSRTYGKKRFSLYSREEYSGNDYFDYDFFGEDIHSVVLREEWTDAMIHELVADRENVMIQQNIPVTVFLNGERWYDSYIREKYSEKLIAERYHLDDDDVTIYKGTPQEIGDYITEHPDLTSDAEYEDFCKVIDVDSYIDWMCINIYICNMDASEWKNSIIWRCNTASDNPYADGRWRYVIFDTECLTWAVEAEDAATINSFSVEKQLAPPAYDQQYIFRAFRTNQQFCKKFVLTFMDLVNSNFNVDVVSEKLKKWNTDIAWNNSFFERRAEYMVPALYWEFALSGTLEDITLKVNDATAGTVRINTITPDLSKGEWTGSYYTDYPVTITAKPKEGYRFAGWSDGQNILSGETMELTIPVGGCTYEAIFEKEQ